MLETVLPGDFTKSPPDASIFRKNHQDPSARASVLSHIQKRFKYQAEELNPIEPLPPYAENTKVRADDAWEYGSVRA